MNVRKYVGLTMLATLVVAAGAATLWAAETSPASEAAGMPEMPPPQAEHEWLERFVGNWKSEAKATMGPDQPPMECKGSQQARSLGGFWTIIEGETEMMGMQVKSVFTLGYDPANSQYVATWIDSFTPILWKYTGEVSADGKTLTLHTEGPNLMQPGTTAKYRETIEFQDDDHYVFTSSAQPKGGEWATFMVANFHRVK